MVDSLAQTYLSAAFSLPGLAAEAAATRKSSNYAAITLTHIFVPVAIKTLGPVNAEGLRFLDQIDNKLSAVTADSRESSFLYQRLYVLVQRFKMIVFHGFLISETDTEA